MKNIVTISVFLAIVAYSCGSIRFDMKGASFGNAKTCQVVYFENRADIVEPRLAAQMTDALKDKIQSNSPLRLVNSNADVTFECEITGYSTQSGQITAQNKAETDRLTITVKVKFTNMLDSEESYDKSFSRFSEATGGMDTAAEARAVEAIIPEIMEDIYNEAFAKW